MDIGPAAGDQLLVEASHRLRSRLRVSDTLSRMGGDEYVLILRNSHHDPEQVADDFRKALSGQLFSYGGKHYRITASIGVAVLDRQVLSPSEAMANADIACHIAKNKGRNQVHVYSYDTDQRASMDVELNWSARLEEAIRDNLFVLCFQPILPLPSVDLANLPVADGDLWMRHLHHGRPRRVYYEVLLRMRSASGELVAPDAFLPTAERYNMMLDIDRWVIHHALKALRERTCPACSMRIRSGSRTPACWKHQLQGGDRAQLFRCQRHPPTHLAAVAAQAHSPLCAFVHRPQRCRAAPSVRPRITIP